MGGSRIPFPFAVWLLQTILATVLVSSAERGEHHASCTGGTQHPTPSGIREYTCRGGWTTGLQLGCSLRDSRFCLRLRGAGPVPPAGTDAEGHPHRVYEAYPGVQADAGARPGRRWFGPFQLPTTAAEIMAGKGKMPIEYLAVAHMERMKDPEGLTPPANISLEQRLARGVCDARGVPPQISRASPWLPLHVASGGTRLAGAGQRVTLIRAM